MDPIYNLVEKLAILEGRITPTSVKQGLNAQQKAVPQLPALFKPKNISTVLDKKKDPTHPMKDYFVGEEEETVAEDMLDKVKRSFADYLQSVEDRIKDDHDLGSPALDRDILARKPDTVELVIKPVKEDPTQENPGATSGGATNPTLPEAGPVKSVELDDGRLCEIHGNERTGFEIRHGNRRLKSRFENLQNAEMALEMFLARRQNLTQEDPAQDYLEEK